MTEELIAKAKEAQSPEELLTLARENGMEEFTQEDAEQLYAQMHTVGELTDEEMENVAGGCSDKPPVHKIVTKCTNCFTGKWESGLVKIKDPAADRYQYSDLLRIDNQGLRALWASSSQEGQCGTCIHLGVIRYSGYCEVSRI